MRVDEDADCVTAAVSAESRADRGADGRAKTHTPRAKRGAAAGARIAGGSLGVGRNNAHANSLEKSRAAKPQVR